jgi:SAM-dependent methyltransferase
MDELAGYYARIAAKYEVIYAKPERQENLETLRVRLRKLFAGRRVLELACGTGYWTDVIAETAAEVTAVDINEEMLDVARSKKNAGKVTFVQGSVFEIPDFGRRHDALFAGHWWSHVRLEDLDAFLGHAAAAVAPGALLAFFDNRYVEGSSTAIGRRDAKGNSFQTRKLGDGSTQEVLKNFPSESELIQRTVRHGWGANVDLLKYYWLLTWWAPR